MISLSVAKHRVMQLLGLAEGLCPPGSEADYVYQAIRKGERDGRQWSGWTEEHAEDYGMLRLALCDITGNANYRC